MNIGNVLVRLRGENSDLNRALRGSAKEARDLHKGLDDADDSSKKLSKSLEVSNDRATMLVQAALALGPALVPLGAQAVPIVAGLASQFMFAAGAIGVTALAFSGLGDALKAVDDYAMQPTEAHLQKMNEELSKLGPAGQDFVHYLQDLRPELQRLQDIAQEGLLPGVQEGMDELLTQMPEVERVVGTISSTLGDLAAAAGRDLAGDDWQAFFDYVQNQARPILIEFSNTVGNFVQGLGNIMVAFDPMTRDFSEGFLAMSRDFEQWSEGLANSEGFHDFVGYIRDTGPQAWETLGALSEALLALVQAAAPVGQVALPVIEALADALKVFIASPVGPALIGVAAGLSAVSRAIALGEAANASALGKQVTGIVKGAPAVAAFRREVEGTLPSLRDYGTVAYRLGQSTENASEKTLKARERVASLRPVYATAAAGVGALALSFTDLDESMGISNTAMFALMGAMAGPWGAAIGGAAGAALDLAAANDMVEASIRDAQIALDSSTMTFEQQKRALEEAAAAQEEYALSVARGRLAGFGGGSSSFVDNFKDSWNALSDVITNSSEEGADAIQQMQDELRNTEGYLSSSQQAYEQHAQSILANVNAMRALREERLRDRNAELGYEGALLDINEHFEKRKQLLKELAAAETPEDRARIREELENYKLTLDKTTRAGQENWRLLYGLAAGWNELGEKTQNVDGAYKRAIEKFVDGAVKMGMSEEAARKLAKRLLEIPTKRETQILVDAGQAFRTIDGVRMALRNLDGTVSETYIRTTRIAHQTNRLGGEPGVATGGYITGPGTGTSDSIPAWLSNGEFVIKAAAVDMYGVDFLHQINAMKYANGGMVRATPQTSVTHNNYGAGIDYGKLTAAMAAGRPLYGDVHVYGDGDFERQTRARKVTRGGGGVVF